MPVYVIYVVCKARRAHYSSSPPFATAAAAAQHESSMKVNDDYWLQFFLKALSPFRKWLPFKAFCSWLSNNNTYCIGSCLSPEIPSTEEFGISGLRIMSRMHWCMFSICGFSTRTSNKMHFLEVFKQIPSFENQCEYTRLERCRGAPRRWRRICSKGRKNVLRRIICLTQCQLSLHVSCLFLLILFSNLSSLL